MNNFQQQWYNASIFERYPIRRTFEAPLNKRDAQFALALTLLDEELYAVKLENFPDVNIPDNFLCGISGNIMMNPVYDPNHPQQKYDLLVLEVWVHKHATNPCTRAPLVMENLVYDEDLKAQIDEFMTETLAAQRLQFS